MTQPITLTPTKIPSSLLNTQSVQLFPESLGSTHCVFWSQPKKPVEKEKVNLKWPQLQFPCGLLASPHHREWHFGCQCLLRSKESEVPMQLLVISFSTPDGLTIRWTPIIIMSRFILPSIYWRYSSYYFLLFLCPKSNLLRSHSISVFYDKCFSLISSDQTASCSSLFYMIWLRKREGNLLFPSEISQSFSMADILVQCLSFLGPHIYPPGICLWRSYCQASRY